MLDLTLEVDQPVASASFGHDRQDQDENSLQYSCLMFYVYGEEAALTKPWYRDAAGELGYLRQSSECHARA
jgi:hypothetical protein